MSVTPYFGNIRDQLIDCLDKAESSIKIAMAWFTNQTIFQVVIDKAASGVKVELLISDSESNFRQNSALDFSALERKFMFVHVMRTTNNRFMHHKFAVIDNSRVLTGSYNWSGSAHTNMENMIVIDDSALAKIYSVQFDHLVQNNYAVTLSEFLENFQVTAAIETEVVDVVMFNLEKQFNLEVEAAMRETERIGVKLRFDIVYGMIRRYTAVGAAAKLSNDAEQSGFLKLIEINRADLTFEYLTSKAVFAKLFDKRTVDSAKNKLYRYIGDEVNMI